MKNTKDSLDDDGNEKYNNNTILERTYHVRQYDGCTVENENICFVLILLILIFC